MDNENIKEILDSIQEHLKENEENFKKGAVDSTVYYLYCDDARTLLDCITNLQQDLETVSGSHFKIFQENKILKEKIKTLYKYTPEKGFRLVGDEE